MIICDLDNHLDERDYYTSIPSLVVEVLSESTQSKDLVTKLQLYMESGVKEYWIVNPLNMEITIYHFEDYQIKNTQTYKDTDNALSFIYIDLSVKLAQIFKKS